jgi:glutathione S-transferase
MTGKVNWYRHHIGRENADALERFVGQVDRCYGVLEGQLGKAASGHVLERRHSCVEIYFYLWLRSLSTQG